MIATTFATQTPSAVPTATALNAKLAEARRGSYSIDIADKVCISDEIGRMTTRQHMALWDGADDQGRKTLIALTAASCGPETAANVIREWLMAEAVEIATAQVKAQMAGAVAATERALDEAAAAADEALHQEKLALAERAEALELLREARRIRNEAAMLAEVEDLRAQLREANAKLNAVSMALGG